MEYDESRVVTRLIAEAMIKAREEFPDISYQQTCIFAAIHLTKDMAFPSGFEHEIRNTIERLIGSLRLERSDGYRLDKAFTNKLSELYHERRANYGREQRIKTATYFIDKYVSGAYQIPTSHPIVVASLVGSIQSTTNTPLFDVVPISAELSMGKSHDLDKSSFPMGSPTSESLKLLITLKLLINEIQPLFTETTPSNIINRTPTHLIDLGLSNSYNSLNLSQFEKIINAHPEPARFMFVIPNNKTHPKQLTKIFSSRRHAGVRLDAVICFSSADKKDIWKDQLLIVLSQGIRHISDRALYVDVSSSNKSLKKLDIQERAILAAHTFNIHEQRRITNHYSKFIPSKVMTILNAQFHEGYRNVKTLCITNEQDHDHAIKIQSPKSFIRAHQLDGQAFNIAADPQDIIERLSDSNRPVCIYIIGNNGAGKTLLLCELIERMSALQRRTVGISTGVHDRFPFGQTAQKLNFEYKGVRTRAESISPSQLTKSVVTLAAKVFVDQQMLNALTECQKCLGYVTRYYLTLKPEMALEETPAEIRFMQMSPSASDNRIPDRLDDYEFGLVRPETESQGERIISYSSLSSGEQNINQLLLSVITSAEPGKVFLIDEPEISLHLQWQQTLPRVFHLLSQRFGCSFVVATHAPTLISNANDEGSQSFLLDLGLLKKLSEDDRYSVESIILGGFGTYTPHNRAVHENCARLVALTMGAKRHMPPNHIDPLHELGKMKLSMEKEPGAYIPPGQQEDLDLISKAYTAIDMLLREQHAADKQEEKMVEVDND